MTDPVYGPHRPAFLTVSHDRLERWMSPRGARFDFPTDFGVTDFHYETTPNPDPSVTGQNSVLWFVRLTFRDDWAAAEFALRFA